MGVNMGPNGPHPDQQSHPHPPPPPPSAGNPKKKRRTNANVAQQPPQQPPSVQVNSPFYTKAKLPFLFVQKKKILIFKEIK